MPNKAPAVVEFLLARRSSKPPLLSEPGPAPAEVETILTAATRVPDHKAVAPWRFIVIAGEARGKLGAVLADACMAEEKEPPSPVRLDTERGRFLQAPMCIAVVSHVKATPGAPEWEQILSAGAATFNLCLAANALGYGTAWITGWYAYSPRVGAALGLTDGERIAGFVYIGTRKDIQADRPRPPLAGIVTYWQG